MDTWQGFTTSQALSQGVVRMANVYLRMLCRRCSKDGGIAAETSSNAILKDALTRLSTERRSAIFGWGPRDPISVGYLRCRVQVWESFPLEGHKGEQA